MAFRVYQLRLPVLMVVDQRCNMGQVRAAGLYHFETINAGSVAGRFPMQAEAENLSTETQESYGWSGLPEAQRAMSGKFALHRS